MKFKMKSAQQSQTRSPLKNVDDPLLQTTWFGCFKFWYIALLSGPLPGLFK